MRGGDGCATFDGMSEQVPVIIGFAAYAGDCTITGQLALARDRLSDMLNEASEIVVRDAVLEGLADPRPVHVRELPLQRDDLYLVEATGPRGPQDRRIHTVRHRLRFQVGPYTVLGQLHAMPGVAPLRSPRLRRSMVPLTNATIAFVRGGSLQMHDASALVVNGAHIEWVGSSAPGELEDEATA